MSVTRPLPHDSAELHVTGAAIYVDDVPAPAGVLILGVVKDGPADRAGARGTERDPASGDVRVGDVIVRLGDAAAVAAHRWHQEGLEAEHFEFLDEALGNQCDISDTATADRDSDGFAWIDLGVEIKALYFGADGGWNIPEGWGVEFLADAQHTGCGHGFSPILLF